MGNTGENVADITSLSKDIRSEYGVEFEANPNSNDVLLLFSHHSNPILKSINFPYNVIRVSDKGTSYYTHKAGELTQSLYAFVKSRNFNNICFLGHSKGAYGAGLIASRFAQIDEDISLTVILFAPQVVLYPHNAQLRFPSYHKLTERAAAEVSVRQELEQYGHFSSAIGHNDIKLYCVLSEGNKEDIKEARQLPGNARYIMVPMRHHVTLVPFISDISDEKSVEDCVRSLFQRSAADMDLAAILGKGADDLLADLKQMRHIPSISELIEFCVAGDMQFEKLGSLKLQHSVAAV